MTIDPDFQVLDRVLAGEHQAYGLLVERHKDFAYTIAWRILGNRYEAEEAAQDAFLRAFRSLKRFGRQSKFSTWLYRIVFNVSISYKRKQKKVFQGLDGVEKEGVHGMDVNEQLERGDKLKYIEIAMHQLNEADRAALTLFYFRELSIEEIAEVTGQGVNTAKVRIHRARQRLAGALKSILKEEALSL